MLTGKDFITVHGGSIGSRQVAVAELRDSVSYSKQVPIISPPVKMPGTPLGNRIDGLPSTDDLVGASVAAPGLRDGTIVTRILARAVEPSAASPGKPGSVEVSTASQSPPPDEPVDVEFSWPSPPISMPEGVRYLIIRPRWPASLAEKQEKRDAKERRKADQAKMQAKTAAEAGGITYNAPPAGFPSQNPGESHEAYDVRVKRWQDDTRNSRAKELEDRLGAPPAATDLSEPTPFVPSQQEDASKRFEWPRPNVQDDSDTALQPVALQPSFVAPAVAAPFDRVGNASRDDVAEHVDEPEIKTLEALTVRLPPNPIDGQIAHIFSAAPITALTMMPHHGGQAVEPVFVGPLEAARAIEFLYSTSDRAWDRCY